MHERVEAISRSLRSVPRLQRFVDDADHGPLPAVLVVLTLTTGVIDAVSILSLGHVFVANMTGNVAFLGFALVGAAGFSLAASLTALVAFFAGAFGIGVLLRRTIIDRLVLIRIAIVAEIALVVVALVVAAIGEEPFTGIGRTLILTLLALAMGIQNAAARQLAVPDLTSTVLTLTFTGLAVDGLRKQSRATMTRRGAALGAMLIGALAGAAIDIHGGAVWALALAILLLLLAGGAAAVLPTQLGQWRRRR
ncbi:MAG: conserved rane protein of unknown function [Ilumatobacteraceae bacterium]|nr:conserved rane protein of unknown function [Ilumatobacteraceae bacterium]